MAAPNEEETVLQGRDLPAIFRLWEEKHLTSGYDPVPILTRLSEIFEEETEIYMQKDRDPFDERHPSRTDPDCELGRMLKLLFRKDHFMTKLVSDYLRDNFFTRQNIQKSSQPLNIAACRLILVIMPGLETSAVFQSEYDNLIHRLYNWAENSTEPLRSYATGLLGAAMEVQDISAGFREPNTRLVPIILKRLHALQAEAKCNRTEPLTNGTSDGQCSSKSVTDDVLCVKNQNTCDANSSAETSDLNLSRPFAHLGGGSAPSSPETRSPQMNGSMTKFKNTINLSTLTETSQQSNDNKYVRYTIPIHPCTIETMQMLTLRYLASMGEYQEFLPQVYEYNAMQLIFHYIENVDPNNTCIAFEALKYLASLLCHKKFSLEFINNGGLERLMKVPKPSVSATSVSIALYYLAYCEDAMERICLMSQSFVTEVVKYALWLLSCPHDTGRCHAAMFLGLSFQFKIILDEFDKQDGIRKLFNMISVLPILSAEEHDLNDDEECAARQLIRHVSGSLKKYLESHLFFKYTQLSRLNVPSNSQQPNPLYRAPKLSPEQISDQATALQEMLPVRARWEPIENILSLNGIQLLLRVMAYSYEWSYSRRSDTVRSALDVLAICCVLPRVHLVFCERMEFPDDGSEAGINLILGAAEGEIVTDAEVQKSALTVLVHCVCAPICKIPTAVRYGSKGQKIQNKNSLEMITKVWESVRSSNGIIVLLHLMETKLPITDADCIRGLACRAMAGLARSETVRQIISKLPIFANGLLQSLMRDPILQEKRAEHVKFQKYALELLERVSGKSKSGNQLDASLANIHKANVVAQTKIQFNEQQLYELMHEHLVSRGLTESASTLQREANLPPSITKPSSATSSFVHSPFAFRTPTTPAGRMRIRSKQNEFNNSLIDISPQLTTPINGSMRMEIDEPTTPYNAPIKLIKKNPQNVNQLQQQQQQQQQQRSLQKQISAIDSPYNGPGPRAQTSTDTPIKPPITLETIITEYLTNQHALCKNPMSTCPQFDLILPHKCPDPRPNRVYGTSTNFAARYFRQQAGFSSRRFDRRLVHSNFAVARTIRLDDPELFFSCCAFAPCATRILVGSYSGDVRVYNINESGEEFSHNYNESNISSIKCSRDGSLVTTSCTSSTTWHESLSVLWSIANNQFQLKHSWIGAEYVEFANTRNDRILGTTAEVATIYDLNTGQKILQFSPTTCNQYTNNRATYYPTDELILSDGVLWDIRSSKAIHKFDKLNQAISGVFHPNGLEVVSNTEVWDLRTFHLLRTVPVLDQCYVTFSPQNVIYGMNSGSNRIDIDPVYESSFKTLDAYDYSSIATVDVKRNIFDLSINKYGSQIAVVENAGQSLYGAAEESAVRIYNVGRRKNMEDDAEDEDDEMAVSEDGTLSDNDSIENGNGERPVRRARNNAQSDDDDDDDDDPNLEDWANDSSSSDDNEFHLLYMTSPEYEADENNDNNDDNDDGGSENENGASDNEESAWVTDDDDAN